MKGVSEESLEPSSGDRTGKGGPTAGEREPRSDSSPTGAAAGTAAAKRILGAKLRRDPKIQAILEHLTGGQPLGDGPVPWLQAQGVDPQLVAEVDSHLRKGHRAEGEVVLRGVTTGAGLLRRFVFSGTESARGAQAQTPAETTTTPAAPGVAPTAPMAGTAEASLSSARGEVAEHGTEWSREGAIDRRRTGLPEAQGAPKCNLFIEHNLRQAGFIPPGSKADGSFDRRSVNSMIDQIKRAEKGKAPKDGFEEWFEVVPGIESARPGDLLVIAGEDRRDIETIHGHIGFLSEVTYDTEAGQLRTITTIEARSEQGAVEGPAGGERGRRTTWTHLEGKEELAHPVLQKGVRIIRPRARQVAPPATIPTQAPSAAGVQP